MMESKALQDKLEQEKQDLAARMQETNKEMAEKMAKDEELRKKEAESLKTNLENQKKQQGNERSVQVINYQENNESL